MVLRFRTTRQQHRCKLSDQIRSHRAGSVVRHLQFAASCSQPHSCKLNRGDCSSIVSTSVLVRRDQCSWRTRFRGTLLCRLQRSALSAVRVFATTCSRKGLRFPPLLIHSFYHHKRHPSIKEVTEIVSAGVLSASVLQALLLDPCSAHAASLPLPLAGPLKTS